MSILSARMSFALAAGLLLAGGAFAQLPINSGVVRDALKISRTNGGFRGNLDLGDQFGRALAVLGDLDGNGTDDYAVGALGDDDGGDDLGAMWIVFMRPDGRVLDQTKISARAGNFTGMLDLGDQFGRAACEINDLNGDGRRELAVGAVFDDDGGPDRGAVWILHLNTDGTVQTHSKISSTQGNFRGVLNNGDQFGRALADLGDLDGDGVPDLAVGASYDDDGGLNTGAVWILFMNRDGSVKDEVKISKWHGNFRGGLAMLDYFGHAVASLGDFDGDGVGDMIIGSVLDDGRNGLFNCGAVWIVLLNRDGTVKDQVRIGDLDGGFTGELGERDQFGVSVAAIGDLDGDGVTDIAVGAVKDDDGAVEAGAVWILFLRADGTVKRYEKISKTMGGLRWPLNEQDWLGSSLARIGDFDGDRIPDLLVGARLDDDGASNTGAIYFMLLDGAEPDDPGPGPGEGPTADFQAAPRTGEVPLTVAFSDASTAGVTAWSWDFGDGTGSVQRSPNHTYLATGDFTVTLRVRNPDGSDELVRLNHITVEGGMPDGIQPYGCGFNAPETMVLISGEPTIGSTLQFGIDNPFGTQSLGSIPRVAFSLFPDPAYPCGRLLPPLGMNGPGELLVDMNRLLAIYSGAPWAGPGTLGLVTVPIPSDPSLIGTQAYVQGVLNDIAPGATIKNGLTAAFEFEIGS